MKCDKCVMLSINGVATHEHGCPNGKNHRWDEDAQTWFKTYECWKCGYDYDERNECDCSDWDDESGGEPTTRDAKMMLLFDSCRGIYIPKNFADETDRSRVEGVSDEDYEVLAAGPDHEWYWDTWADVLDNAVLTDNDGTKYALYQDGDVWTVEQGAEYDETTDTFVVVLS